MPFSSKAQVRLMFARHPTIAKRFAKETPDIGKLPQYVSAGGEIEPAEEQGEMMTCPNCGHTFRSGDSGMDGSPSGGEEGMGEEGSYYGGEEYDFGQQNPDNERTDDARQMSFARSLRTRRRMNMGGPVGYMRGGYAHGR